jgi:hypothetical protein
MNHAARVHGNISIDAWRLKRSVVTGQEKDREKQQECRRGHEHGQQQVSGAAVTIEAGEVSNSHCH